MFKIMFFISQTLILILFQSCAIPKTIKVESVAGSENVEILQQVSDKTKCSYIGDAIGSSLSSDKNEGMHASLIDLGNTAYAMGGDTVDVSMALRLMPGLIDDIWQTITFSRRDQYAVYAQVLQCKKITTEKDGVQITEMEPSQNKCQYLGDHFFEAKDHPKNTKIVLSKLVDEIKNLTMEKKGNLFVITTKSKINLFDQAGRSTYFIHGRFFNCQGNGKTNLL